MSKMYNAPTTIVSTACGSRLTACSAPLHACTARSVAVTSATTGYNDHKTLPTRTLKRLAEVAHRGALCGANEQTCMCILVSSRHTLKRAPRVAIVLSDSGTQCALNRQKNSPLPGNFFGTEYRTKCKVHSDNSDTPRSKRLPTNSLHTNPPSLSRARAQALFHYRTLNVEFHSS